MNLDQLQQLLSVVSQYIVTFFKIHCGKGASAAACFPPSHSFYTGALKSQSIILQKSLGWLVK